MGNSVKQKCNYTFTENEYTLHVVISACVGRESTKVLIFLQGEGIILPVIVDCVHYVLIM